VLQLVPAAVRQRLGVGAQEPKLESKRSLVSSIAAPAVARCRSRSGGWLWRLGGIYQSARQLALQVLAAPLLARALHSLTLDAG